MSGVLLKSSQTVVWLFSRPRLPRQSINSLVILIACVSAGVSSCGSLSQRSTRLQDAHSSFESDQRPARINVNTAPATELEKLPGIGKALAERIVAHREQYGPFRRAEHLMMVRGISERKFRELQPLVRVE